MAIQSLRQYAINLQDHHYVIITKGKQTGVRKITDHQKKQGWLPTPSHIYGIAKCNIALTFTSGFEKLKKHGLSFAFHYSPHDNKLLSLILAG